MITILLEKIKALLIELKSNIENIKPTSDYSLSEKKIGTDIDGKDIFMKTIHDIEQMNSSATRSYTIDENVDTQIIGIDARNTWFIRSETTTRLFMNSFYANTNQYAVVVRAVPNQVTIQTGAFGLDEITLTVIYKKVVTP
ncbi:hypothetical protein J6V85_00755 [Candidatus Saccharibacteria bacterium]|nr:hypothetical protein [Candidatus Saccharibacteria bacterium]